MKSKFVSAVKIAVMAIWILALIIIPIIILSGCNAQVIDTTWSYEKAIINMQDGTIVEGEVESWKDYENSDMIQVKIGNTTYFTHISNVILISE